MAKSNKGRKFFATTATAALVASAIVPVASAAQINDFNSISSYAQEAVQDLNDRGVIKGDQKGNFNPKSAITRAEAATILAGALELEGSGSTSFTDVKKSAWYYDAIDAAVANGIFQGQGAGKFNPSANLTRSEAAIILVDAFGLEGSADLKEFKDSASVKSWAEEALSIAVANGVMKGDDNGNLKPNASITRQDFALMYYRTEGVEGTEEVSGSVKAINNTTVEVTFTEEVEDIKALDFAIEGLDVTNAAVKQSNKKTVVLTTSAQTADVEYTVTVNGEAIGKFKGVSAVIPTAIDIVEKSQQNVLGNQVTVKAKVTVATGSSAAGIPVTFNIVNAQQDNNLNPGGALNPPIVAEAITDENGVATYTYTRYASTARDLVTNDEVQAYATGKATVRSFSKVYWASIQPLSITEVTEGNTITNGGKKVYKVKLAGVSTNVTPGGHHSRTVNIGFKENVNVAPDKAVKAVKVTDASGRELGYPGQFTTTSAVTTSTFNSIVLNLDHNGEATFTLTGNNAAVTPFVFKDAYANTSNTDPSYGRFDATELVAEAAKVTFAAQHTLQLVTESIGVSNASAYNASFGTGAVTYYIEDGKSNRLYRNIAGFLQSATVGTVLASGEAWITNNNPLRSNEVLPAGFNYKYTNADQIISDAGVDKLETALNGKSSVRYNMEDAADVLAKDLKNTGGRDYKAVLKDKDGKLATTGTPIKLHVKYGSARTSYAAPIYVIDNNTLTVYKISNFAKSTAEFDFLTNAKGEISFTIIGGRDSYATPTAFVDTNRSTDLDTADLQHAGEIVYFGDRTITSANLAVNGKNEANAIVSDIANFSYQTVDQNNKPYSLSHNTTNGTQSNEYVTSFQVHSGFGIAYVYRTKADADANVNAIEVGQDGTKTITVTSVDGKADIYVKSAVGNKVTVNASASQGTYPNKTASATFTNQFNEGVSSYVRGKVVAIDTTHNRVLLSDSTGKNVYELSYAGADLQSRSQGVTESTFEREVAVGEEVYFTAATENKKASFNNLDRASGVTISENAVIVINGDQTSVPKTYDFANSDLKVKEIVINGDNITLANLNTNATIVVGIPANAAGKYHATIQQVNDTKLDNVKGIGTALPNVVVNRGDLNTFTVQDSNLGAVTLNIPEHVALTNSTIAELILNVSGAKLTGTGTIGKIIAGPTTNYTKEDSVVVTAKSSQELVNEEAAKITSAPAIVDNKLQLPTVADGYTVAIKSSSDEAVIKLDGTVVPAETAKTVDVVLTVTNAKGEKADTKVLTVSVPAKETGEEVMAKDTTAKLVDFLGKQLVSVTGTLVADADKVVIKEVSKELTIAADKTFKGDAAYSTGVEGGKITLVFSKAGVEVGTLEVALTK